MRYVGRLKRIGWQCISRNRRSAAVRLLHGVASYVESAYRNEGSDFALNGEKNLVRKLAGCGFATVFDVGANFGDWALEALETWKQARVHAFEIAPETFEQLKQRIGKSAHHGRAALNGYGLSDNCGRQTMFYYPQHPELTSDVARFEGYDRAAFMAELSTGDRYCDSQQIGQVDFLKVDVEGAEHRVLKGFAERLQQRRVHCVQFEYGWFAADTRFLLADFYAMLSDGYWIGKIYPTYVDFRDYHAAMEDLRFANYCAVSKRRPELKALLAD